MNIISLSLENNCEKEQILLDLRKYYFNIEQHQLLIQYYTAYYQTDFIDLSFMVYDMNRVVALVICSKLQHQINFPGEGIKINLTQDSTVNTTAILKTIIAALEEKAMQHACSTIIIPDKLNAGILSELSNQLFNKRYQARVTFNMEIDFKNFDENIFFKNIRKSYKSLINWGRKNLHIEIINKAHAAKDKFIAFKALHYQVSKRQTRSDESWNIQYDMLRKGYGELILAYYNNKLVGGALLIDKQDSCIYFTGVYVRELFTFGLSHFILYTGIISSFQRKTTQLFYLERFDTDIQDEKIYNIQFFKKGFCNNLTPLLLWEKSICQQ